MKRVFLGVLLFVLCVPSVSAQQSISNLGITSAQDALQMLGQDHFGPIRLSPLLADINSDKVYRGRENYGSGYVEIESDNDPRHFGGINFDFSKDKPDFNVTVEGVRSHMLRIWANETEAAEGAASFTWKSSGFSCMVDVIVDRDYKLFQYLCHYIEGY